MEPSRTPVRRAGLVALAIAFSLVGSACSSGPAQRTALATVGDQRITQDDLDRELKVQEELTKALSKSDTTATTAAEKKQRAEQLDTALRQFDGVGRDTLDTSAIASQLTTVVQTKILEEALRRNGGKVTAAQRETAKTAVSKNFEQQGVKMADLPKSYVTASIERAAVQAAIQTRVKVTQAQLKAAYAEQANDYANICVSLIYVADESAAKAAFDRVTVDGEDFGAVSAAVSTDDAIKQAKGVAGCGATADVAGSLGNGVYSAPVDEPQQPVQVQGGWLIVLVTSRTKPKLADIEAQLRPSIQSKGVQALIQPVLDDVTVDPRVGTWDPKTATVVAPVIPAVPGKQASTTTTTIPVAAVPGS